MDSGGAAPPLHRPPSGLASTRCAPVCSGVLRWEGEEGASPTGRPPPSARRCGKRPVAGGPTCFPSRPRPARRRRGSVPQRSSQRPRGGRLPCSARACRRSVRYSPPRWRRPPRWRGGAVALRQQHRAETAYVQTPSPHHPTVYQTVSWKDQALQIRASEEVRLRGGAQRPPAAAALAGGGSPRQPASGRVELAGGALRAVSDAGDGGGAAPAAAGGLRASCWDGCGALASSGAAASTACGRSSGAAASRTASRPADGTTRAPLAHASGPGERQGGSAGGIGSSATSCIRRRAR